MGTNKPIVFIVKYLRYVLLFCFISNNEIQERAFHYDLLLCCRKSVCVKNVLLIQELCIRYFVFSPQRYRF
jgi:hypothetical protein